MLSSGLLIDSSFGLIVWTYVKVVLASLWPNKDWTPKMITNTQTQMESVHDLIDKHLKGIIEAVSADKAREAARIATAEAVKKELDKFTSVTE